MGDEVTITIQDGKSYERGDGQVACIRGPTKDHPTQYAWSLQGDWYEYATGRFVYYGGNGDHYTVEDSHRNLVKEAPDG